MRRELARRRPPLMHFRVFDREGDTVLELDEEAIDYLETGLADLRERGPGEELSAPSLDDNDAGPVGVSAVVLRRA